METFEWTKMWMMKRWNELGSSAARGNQLPTGGAACRNKCKYDGRWDRISTRRPSVVDVLKSFLWHLINKIYIDKNARRLVLQSSEPAVGCRVKYALPDVLRIVFTINYHESEFVPNPIFYYFFFLNHGSHLLKTFNRTILNMHRGLKSNHIGKGVICHLLHCFLSSPELALTL